MSAPSDHAPLALKRRVALALDGEDPVLGRSVAFFLQALILLSVISISIETMPGLSPEWEHLLAVSEIVTLTVFALEYLLRLWSAERPLGYVFSFWGIIDLIAILPSILMAGTDLRSLRIFRLVRLLRLLKLMRYARAADRLGDAFAEVREELVLFLLMAFMVLYLCAAGIYIFENEAQPDQFASIPHSLWWAVATLTTVGYGDVYPVTAGGKIFTALVLFIGLGIVAVPTGLIATALSRPLPGDAQDDENHELPEAALYHAPGPDRPETDT